ncbi:MAG: polyprenyl synthetase family protein [bacterium]|nr:polyprenyl synthetase family protein [bacterium]
MITGNMVKTISEILRPLEEYLEEVDVTINSKLTTGIPDLDASAKHLFARGGKKVRSSLVILAGGLNGSIPDGIIELAAAAEIVHAATLVHDDIIDHSMMRRGNRTVSRQWGNKIAVLAGDYMYTTALATALDYKNPALFHVVVLGAGDMVKGELYQLQYSNINSITKEHYYRIIELKTARFMAACVKLGAIKAGFNDEECDELYDFGLNLGFAFQIVDDTLDYIDNDTVTGKDVGNDFREGKVTLPLLYLLEKLNVEEQNELKGYLANPTDENWNIVHQKVTGSQAIGYCLDIAGQYIKKALDIIYKYPDSEFREILVELSNFFVSRNF